MKALIPDTGGNTAMQERRASGPWTLVVLIATLLLAVPNAGQAQESTDFFRQNCFSCHTIGGGRLVGPDLKDVGERRDTEWLVDFILNPQAKINSGDPYAQKLLDEARGVVMPAVPGISRGRAEALIAMILEESGLEESQFAGSQISDRPFTPDDIVAGVQRYQELGADLIIFDFRFRYADWLEQIETLARDVFPKVSG